MTGDEIPYNSPQIFDKNSSFNSNNSFTNFNPSVNNDQTDDVKIMKLHLENWCNKIESIISSGKVANENLSLADLFQLQQIIVELIKFVDTKNKVFDLQNKITFPKETATSKDQSNKNSNTKVINDFIINITEIPKVRGLSEIAGLWDIKRILQSIVLLPRNQPQLFFNRKVFNSVLLFGPPGTGKTHLVHALAYEANAVLYSVSVGDILSPLVGQSEKNIQQLFQHINDSEKFSILFIDELDGLCKKRSDTEQEHSRRVKTELMCQISAIEDKPNMFLICATNCPWDLDTAFLRRFQKRMFIPLPDRAERLELFKLFAKDIFADMDSNQLNLLLDKTEGFSGSDLSNLVQHATYLPIFELQDTKLWKMCNNGTYTPVIRTEDFDLEDIVCCEIVDLPPCSVNARNMTSLDFINSLESISITVSKADIEKYQLYVTKL